MTTGSLVRFAPGAEIDHCPVCGAEVEGVRSEAVEVESLLDWSTSSLPPRVYLHPCGHETGTFTMRSSSGRQHVGDWGPAPDHQVPRPVRPSGGWGHRSMSHSEMFWTANAMQWDPAVFEVPIYGWNDDEGEMEFIGWAEAVPAGPGMPAHP